VGAVSIKKPLLGELLGLADHDGPGADETALSTIQVRYDQMFRECVLHRPGISFLAATELEKIARWDACWYDRAKTFQTEELAFKPKEVGLPDNVLSTVNSWPEQLASRCDSLGGLILAQAPQLSFKQSRGNVKLRAWMRVVIAPQLSED
jgi:hypothetical protein